MEEKKKKEAGGGGDETKAKEIEANGEAPASEAPPQKRILVVDDEFEICEFLKDGLSLHQFQVETLQSPTKALELLENGKFDLVLTDLVMPKMDGIALTMAIRQMGIDTPVVVMTGYASIDYAVESMKAGASDFITKPIKLDHVLFIIRRALDAHQMKKMAHEGEYYKLISNLDPLTSIGNFRFLEQILPVEVERHKRYNRMMTVMMIDVDDFKQYNDKYGHQAGDTVLILVANLLKGSVRNCDFVIRYGGEEFVVILPEIGKNRALQVGQRILDAIRTNDYATSSGQDLGKITVTIGMASFPINAQEQNELIRYADEALYYGKRNGKNCLCVFGQPMEMIRE